MTRADFEAIGGTDRDAWTYPNVSASESYKIINRMIFFSRTEWNAQTNVGDRHYDATRDDRDEAIARVHEMVKMDADADAGLIECQHVQVRWCKIKRRYRYVCCRCGADMGKERAR